MRKFSLIVLSIMLAACTDSGTTTHRIDPAVVIADMTAAAFELDARSDLLRSIDDRNADDDHSRIVFDAELRGDTDRLVLRFRKDGMRR